MKLKVEVVKNLNFGTRLISEVVAKKQLIIWKDYFY